MGTKFRNAAHIIMSGTHHQARNRPRCQHTAANELSHGAGRVAHSAGPGLAIVAVSGRLLHNIHVLIKKDTTLHGSTCRCDAAAQLVAKLTENEVSHHFNKNEAPPKFSFATGSNSWLAPADQRRAGQRGQLRHVVGINKGGGLLVGLIVVHFNSLP